MLTVRIVKLQFIGLFSDALLAAAGVAGTSFSFSYVGLMDVPPEGAFVPDSDMVSTGDQVLSDLLGYFRDPQAATATPRGAADCTTGVSVACSSRCRAFRLLVHPGQLPGRGEIP
jgi:hypothetical protein